MGFQARHLFENSEFDGCEMIEFAKRLHDGCKSSMDPQTLSLVFKVPVAKAPTELSQKKSGCRRVRSRSGPKALGVTEQLPEELGKMDRRRKTRDVGWSGLHEAKRGCLWKIERRS